MQLLISVRSRDEALAALTGGADIIDAKDPGAGALGAVSLPTFASIADSIGGEVPVTAAGFPAHEFWPEGRVPQSMAFLSRAGIDRLCSGAKIRKASAASDSALNRATLVGGGLSRSWLNMGKSSIRTNLIASFSPASLANASASLRLMESRRLLPRTTAILTFGMVCPI